MSDQTHNHNNDPIEELFREKAREYDIQYNEEDWQKLETRLDAWDAQRSGQPKRWLAAAAVAIIFSILAYFTYENYQRINQLNERLSSTEQKRVIDDNSLTTDQQKKPEIQKKNGTIATSDKPEKEVPASDENFSTGHDKSIDDETKNSVTEKNKQEFRTNIRGTDLAEAKLSLGFGGRFPAISAIKPLKIEESNTSEISVSGNASPFLASSRDQTISARKATPDLGVGFIAGPDLSTVGSFSNFYNPGYKFGISLEYYLTRNLAISAGALRTTVRYEAGQGEYHPPQGYWSYGVEPNSTVGECILIDIPINLKYDVVHFNNSRIFATAGASSYIMLNEDYRFQYNTTQPGLKQRWEEDTGTKHWFSNATFSIGYELDVSPRWSIRAEPFVKVPLKEVGWGNVSLYSVGTYISFNYGLRY